MKFLKKDKNKGLSEQERLAKAQWDKKFEELRQRFEHALPGFRDEYNQLVRKYGCIHTGRIRVDEALGIQPDVVIRDCWEEVQRIKNVNGKDGEAKIINPKND